MITLEQILEFAVKNSACSAQLNKFKEFIQQGDELSAWQTAMGNYNWLKNTGLDIDMAYLETKSLGIGKVWGNYGQLAIECTYKNNNRDGLYRNWYDNGQLFAEKTYKEGKLDGLFRQWYRDGQLYEECIYKNGELIQNK